MVLIAQAVTQRQERVPMAAGSAKMGQGITGAFARIGSKPELE